MVLATVKGDVHDIGKNLVDIILTNNGYTVVNLGIKQPVSAIIEAALAHNADAIGMSGLLVKSTVVMKDNLVELNSRGLDRLPGAARRRGADPRVRRGGPQRPVRRRGALRPGRLRGAVPDGEGDGRQARRARCSAARAAPPPGRREADRNGTAPAGRECGRFGVRPDARRRPPHRRAHATVLGQPGGEGRQAGRGVGLARRAGHVHGPVGAARQRRRADATRNSSRPRAGRGCGTGSTGSTPTRWWSRPWSTATGRATPRATT